MTSTIPPAPPPGVVRGEPSSRPGGLAHLTRSAPPRREAGPRDLDGAFRRVLHALGERSPAGARLAATPGRRNAPEDERPVFVPPRAARDTRRDLPVEPWELAPFRPAPSVLAPPTLGPAPPVVPPPMPACLVRLRVGRSRDGEVVQLRVRTPEGRELDVDVVASPRGIEVRAEGASAAWKARLARTLAARGVSAEVV